MSVHFSEIIGQMLDFGDDGIFLEVIIAESIQPPFEVVIETIQ